jgi:predicted nucleotidyltransferase
VRRWAENVAQQRQDVVRIGYFGSYARGDWGVGSDLDLVVVVESSDLLFQRRAATWDMIELPVPTDLLVYTQLEEQGFRVLRFWDHEVLQAPAEVQRVIWEALTPPPESSPTRGEEKCTHTFVP